MLGSSRPPRTVASRVGIILRNWHLKLSADPPARPSSTPGSSSPDHLPTRRSRCEWSRRTSRATSFVLGAEPGVVDIEYRVSNDQAAGVTADDFVVSVDISRVRPHAGAGAAAVLAVGGAEPEGRCRDRVRRARLRPCRGGSRRRSLGPRRGGSRNGPRGPRDRRTGRERRYRRGPRPGVRRQPGGPCGRIRRDPRVRHQRERAGPADPGRHRRAAGRDRPARGRPGGGLGPDRGARGRDRDDGRGPSEHRIRHARTRASRSRPSAWIRRT